MPCKGKNEEVEWVLREGVEERKRGAILEERLEKNQRKSKGEKEKFLREKLKARWERSESKLEIS